MRYVDLLVITDGYSCRRYTTRTTSS